MATTTKYAGYTPAELREGSPFFASVLDAKGEWLDATTANRIAEDHGTTVVAMMIGCSLPTEPDAKRHVRTVDLAWALGY